MESFAGVTKQEILRIAYDRSEKNVKVFIPDDYVDASGVSSRSHVLQDAQNILEKSANISVIDYGPNWMVVRGKPFQLSVAFRRLFRDYPNLGTAPSSYKRDVMEGV